MSVEFSYGFLEKKEIVVSHFCCNFQCMIHFTCRVLFFFIYQQYWRMVLRSKSNSMWLQETKIWQCAGQCLLFFHPPLTVNLCFQDKAEIGPFSNKKREKTCVFSLIICWSPKHQTKITEGVRHPILYSCDPFIL